MGHREGAKDAKGICATNGGLVLKFGILKLFSGLRSVVCRLACEGGDLVACSEHGADEGAAEVDEGAGDAADKWESMD
jgi:hypothetical protein